MWYWVMSGLLYIVGPDIKWTQKELSEMPLLKEIFKGISKNSFFVAVAKFNSEI